MKSCENAAPKGPPSKAVIPAGFGPAGEEGLLTVQFALLRQSLEKLLACRERFTLLTDAGFLEMLTFFDFRQYSGFFAFPLETLQGILEGLVLANLDQRHLTDHPTFIPAEAVERR
jgi:hypothetical protein